MNHRHRIALKIEIAEVYPEPTYDCNPNLESTKDKLLLVQFSVVVDVELLEHLRCSLLRHVLRVVLAILLLLDDNSE